MFKFENHCSPAFLGFQLRLLGSLVWPHTEMQNPGDGAGLGGWEVPGMMLAEPEDASLSGRIGSSCSSGAFSSAHVAPWACGDPRSSMTQAEPGNFGPHSSPPHSAWVLWWAK